MRILYVLLLTACGPSPTPDTTNGDDDDDVTVGDDDDDPTDTDTDTDTDTTTTTLTGEYNGTLPPIEIAAPDFAAVNRDGSARSKADLLGHPTVLWFFPFAGTPG